MMFEGKVTIPFCIARFIISCWYGLNLHRKGQTYPDDATREGLRENQTAIACSCAEKSHAVII